MADSLLSGQYDWKLVALSIVIAFFASYITLELAGRSVGPLLQRRNFWIPAGALCITTGLWSVHDLGLLAFHAPILVTRELPTTIISILTALGCSVGTLFLVCWRPAQKLYLVCFNVVISGCLSAMLFSAFEALKLTARPTKPFIYVSISLIASILACLIAYQIGYSSSTAVRNTTWTKLAIGGVMGIATSCIQYAGMFAMNVRSTGTNTSGKMGDSSYVASEILVCAAAILLVVFVFTLVLGEVDRQLASQRGMLRSEQERWNLLMSANQDGLFDFNLATGEVFYSPRWKEIIGYAPDELEDTLEMWQERIHSDDRKEVDASVEEYLRSRQGTAQVEYRLRHRDGTWRWILSRSQAVWNPKGEPVRLVGSQRDVTDSKRALEELTASDARFSAFMEHNPSIAFMKDSTGKFIYTNPTLERIWKLKPGEWIGKSSSQIWPDEVARRVAEDDQQIISTSARSELIEEFQMPDKSVHQFITAKFTFADAAGNSVLGGVSIDVTERMRSEENLRASEGRYRELFENNPLPSWIYRTSDLRIIDVNQAAIDHYGWQHDQFLNLTNQSLRIPNQTEVEREPKPGVKGRIRIGPIRHRRNKRSDIWVELSSHEFTSGGAECRLVMAIDVTERIASEVDLLREHGQLENLVAQRALELQTSEAKWHSLVEALPQIVWTSRSDGYCEYISQHLAEYTGVTVTDLLGWGWLGFIHKSDRERVRTTWMAAVAKGSDYEVEYRILSKTGQYRWFMTRGRSMSAAERLDAERPAADRSVITSWLGTTSDIEDQKRRKEQLEAAVAERTLALAEARDLAQNEASAKSRFLASISHEIRTPLNGVLGATSLLSETSLNSDQHTHIKTIRSFGDALLNVMNDVLDVSKIEAGKMHLDEVEFNLESMLEECMHLVSSAAAANKIQLNLQVGDHLPFNVLGDAVRVRQVLLSLLSTAVKSHGIGSVTLAATPEAALPEHPESKVCRFTIHAVSDGIMAVEQSIVLQPTVNGNALNGQQSVTELSLSVAKRLLDLMGGSLSVVNEVDGEGSTFGFSLPLKPGSSTVPHEFQVLAGKRVLVLPSPGMATIQRYLKRAQIEVTAPSAKEDRLTNGALKQSPDLVIADALTMESGTFVYPDRCPLLIIGSDDSRTRTGIVPAHELDFLATPVRCLPLLRAVKRMLTSRDYPQEELQSDKELSNARILLVEDEQVNQLITKLFLVKLGCHVTVAGNGLEACAALEFRTYDLILMDCQMPEMDGFQATRIIRQREAGKHQRTPIIALSAGVLKEERERCYAAGMDDFLSKPLEKPELESALTNWLKRQTTNLRAAGS